MKKSMWKKPLAFCLAFTMMLSMAACGKGEKKNGGTDNKAAAVDVKNCTFSGEAIDISAIKGEPGTFVLANDKIYFISTEWPDIPEEESSTEEVNAESSESVTTTGNDEEAVTEEGTSDTTEEAASEEDASNTTEEAASEEDASNTTEVTASEEDASDTTEETASEDAASDATEEAASTEEADTEGGTAMEEEMNYTPTTRIYSMNTDGTDIKEICEPQIEKNQYLQNLLVDKNSNMYAVITIWNEKTETSTYELAKIDESGKLSDNVDITKAGGFTQDEYISKITLADDGGLIVSLDQKIVVLDNTFKKTSEIKSDNTYIEGIARTLDGGLVCGSSDEKGAVAQIVDLKEKKFGEKYKLDIQYFNGSDSLIDGNGDYDFYYKDNSGIFGYSIKDSKSTKIMDFMASEINGENMYNIMPVNSETMVGTSWDDSGIVVTMYKKVDPSSIKDKITITYGSQWGVDDTIRNAAIKFNKENDKYRIEFIDYSTAGDEAQTKMNADIVAGKVPDIIDLSGLPVGQYISKGILEDLTPYYEKDSDISLDDIVPSIRKAMEVEGKQYYIAQSFSVSTLVASTKDVGDKTGWTFDEMKQLLESKGEGVRPFYSEDKNSMLDSFLNGSMEDYIDWTTGKCRFDSDDFKSVLEISNRGKNEEVEYNEDSPSLPSLIKDGKVLFQEGGMDIESVQLYKKMYNGDITFIGYPSEDKNGSFFSLNNKMGIYAKSEAKEAAWEFIRQFISMEYQAKLNNIYGVPTNQKAFEMFMKTKTATKPYKDELGQDIEPLDSSWGWDDLEVKITPLSADEEKMYRDLIANTTKISEYNWEISAIILEEAKAYFAGQKSLDDTADIIQNRVSTYVNENR